MRFPFRKSFRCAFPFVIFALLLAESAWAQVYKYRDPATGKIILSDNPPSGQHAQSTPVTGGPAEDAPEVEESGAASKSKPSGIDPRLQARKKEEEARERASKEAKNAELEARKLQYCADVQRNIKTLESGRRMVQMNESGGRQVMSQDARNAEIERLRSELSACE